MSDTLDLVALRRPRTIKFPSGNVVPVESYRGHGVALLRQYRAETDPLIRGAQLEELLRLAVPTASEEDLGDTGPEDWSRIAQVLFAGRRHGEPEQLLELRSADERIRLRAILPQ